MYYYTVNEDVVLSRTVRKKIKTVEDAVSYLHGINADVKVFVIHAEAEGLYAKCKELSAFAEDYIATAWFVAECEDDAKAGAIISVIEAHSLWGILMSEAEFNNWVKTNVR